MKLSIKLMIAMLLITAVPLMVLSATLQYNTRRFYDQNTEKLYQQIARQYTESLRYKYHNYRNMAGSVVTISGMRDLLGSGAASFSEVYGQASELSTALGRMSTYYNNGNELFNMMVYSLRDTPPLYTAKVVSYKDSLHFNLLSDENLRRGYCVREGANRRELLSLFFPVAASENEPEDVIAYLVLDIDADKFFSLPSGDYVQDTQIALRVDDAQGMLWSGGDVPDAREDAMRYEFAAPDPMERFGWTLCMDFYSASSRAYGGYQFTILGVTGVLILLALLFAAVFSRRFGARVGMLTQKMQRVQEGDMSPAPPIGGGDELADIDQYFNKMVEKLNVYIRENFLQRIAYKEAQFNILQNQINPHFLYNTLEVIDSMASTRGCFEIGDVCVKLGQLFRYNVTKNPREYVRLGDELQHVKNYADIQQLRFSGRFCIGYDVAPGCEEVLMLKFILQPLVENAIVHALESRQDGMLRIAARRWEDGVEIEVSDNGSGFEEEKLREINRFIGAGPDESYVDFSGGIGLKNVITRVKLVYGERARIEIHSGTSTGTSVTLRLAGIEQTGES